MTGKAVAQGLGTPHDPDPAVAEIIDRSRRAERRRLAVIWISRFVLLAVVLLFWEAAVRGGLAKALFFSQPTAVVEFLANAIRTGELTNHTVVTVVETIYGFVIGSAAGIVAGLTLARFATLDAIFDPFLNVLNSLPRVALAPLFILWFGIDQQSKVALAVSLVFFILVVNTRAGVRTVPEEFIIIARSLGAGERQMFTKVILPGAVPAIFAGLRLGAVYSLIGVVVGEMIAARAGLGQQLTYYSGTFNTAGVFAVLVILGAIAAILNAAMVAIETRLLRWQVTNR